MFGLGFAQRLELEGFGTYGESVFWNTSPLLGSGLVTSDYGLWVAENGVSDRSSQFYGQLFTSEIVVSARYADPLQQALAVTRLVTFINTRFQDTCTLLVDLGDYGQITLTVRGDMGLAALPTLVAVDGEGLLVQETRFTVSYTINGLPT